MQLIVGIFLETLLKPHALNEPVKFNRTRLALLKPYLNNSNYEVFIYITNAYTESKYNYLYFELLEVGIKTGLYSSPQIINISEKRLMNKFLKHIAYLKQRADQGDAVIMIGAFTAQSTWVQASDFSLVDWPNDSTTTLAQLFSEQLLIQSGNVIHDKGAKLETTASSFSPVKRIVRRAPFPCAKEMQELIESIQILREDIKNLTRISLQLETEQLDLQKQMISAEKAQTNLISELLTHAPLALLEIGLTSIILLLHIGEIFCYVKKCYKKCHSSKTLASDSNIEVLKSNTSTQTPTNTLAYSSSSSSRESSLDKTTPLKNNGKTTQLKNFAKEGGRSAKDIRANVSKFFTGNSGYAVLVAGNDPLYSEQASLGEGYQQPSV